MFFRSGEELRTQKTLADKQISPLDVEGVDSPTGQNETVMNR